MHRDDLIDPQTEEQEAEIAAYIARECERIRASWTGGDAGGDIGESFELSEVKYRGIRARALEALRQRTEQRQADEDNV